MKKNNNKVPRSFDISDIQSSPARDEGQVYASCVRSSMIYGIEAKSLQANVGLNFERAEMQMI